MATNVGKVGIVMKGDWNSSATYEVLDAVSYPNGLYIAKQAVPANTAPTNTTYWQKAIESVVIHKENVSIPVSSDNSSPLGYYGTKIISDLVSQYGDVIGVWTSDQNGYPAIASYRVSGSNHIISVSGKYASGGTMTAQVAFAK